MSNTVMVRENFELIVLFSRKYIPENMLATHFYPASQHENTARRGLSARQERVLRRN